MHRTVRDATGYTLLLSSVVTLAVLLREGWRRTKKSSFYVLSASDVLSTILTAVALLLNHAEAGVKLSYGRRNGTAGGTPDRTWTIRDESKYQLLFSRARETEIDASNATLTCDAGNVLAQYGMLLGPLTNAFVSLLTLAVQCNLHATCLRRRCADATRSATASDARPGSRRATDVARRETEASEDERRKSAGGVARRVKRFLKLRALKGSDKRSAGLLVTGHWLLPFLVITTLYAASYSDTGVARRAEDAECLLQGNFPVNDFYVLLNSEDYPKLVGSGIRVTSLENDRFVNEGTSSEPSSSSREVERIVSKVQDIVKILLNKNARNSTASPAETVNLLDALEWRNVTEYAVTSNAMHIKDDTSAKTAIEGSSNTALEQNDTSRGVDEATMMSGVAETSTPSKDEKDARIASAEEDASRRTSDTRVAANTTFISKNQIYADIIKRIQAASAHLAMRNHYNRSVDRLGEQPIRNSYDARMKPNPIEDLLFSESDFDRDTETENGSMHMNNECLVSTKFLKLHLFVLFFTIYLLPILLCCILQIRGGHVCKKAVATLRAKADLASTSSRGNVGPNEGSKAAVAVEPRSKLLFANDESTGDQTSIEGLDTMEEMKDSCGGKTNTEVTSKNHTDMQDKSALLEVRYMARTFKTVNASLILCVVLWTPVFLVTLLRVFLCVHAPRWLIDATFLSAIFFGAVRNLFNINIIKIQERCNVGAKENRIHPVE